MSIVSLQIALEHVNNILTMHSGGVKSENLE